MSRITTLNLGTFLGRAERDLEAALRPSTRALDWRLLSLARRLEAMERPPADLEPVTLDEFVRAYREALRAPVDPQYLMACGAGATSMTPDEAARTYNERLRHP